MLTDAERRELSDIIRKQNAIIALPIEWEFHHDTASDYSDLEYRRMELEILPRVLWSPNSPTKGD